MSKFLKENMSFSVMLSSNVTDSQISAIRKNLDGQPFVKSSRFISKQEAKEQLIKDLGEDPEELLGTILHKTALRFFSIRNMPIATVLPL